jgi:ATP-dependent Lon protease
VRLILRPLDDPDLEEPNPDQIYQVGTAAIVHRMLRAPDGTIRLIVQGIERIRVLEFLQEQPYLRARVEEIPDDEGPEDLESQALIDLVCFAASFPSCRTCGSSGPRR